VSLRVPALSCHFIPQRHIADQEQFTNTPKSRPKHLKHDKIIAITQYRQTVPRLRNKTTKPLSATDFKPIRDLAGELLHEVKRTLCVAVERNIVYSAIVLCYSFCAPRSGSRVYLHDVFVMQLRKEVLNKVRKQHQTINT
jgi:hypothetical protein